MAARQPSFGGLLLEAHKRTAMQRPIAAAPAPPLAWVALDQGDGRPVEPCVHEGQRVRLGSTIGRGRNDNDADLHAPVAGRVRAIAPLAAAVDAGPMIVIENDGSDERDAQCEPGIEPASLAPETLIERIRRAGIVGLGGAGFPTAAKLARGRERAIEHLVLNGAECEPWICCDDALMREAADEVVYGAQLMLHACGAARGTIAVEDDKPEAEAALRIALAGRGDARLALAVLPAFYPAGAERQLLTEVAGVEVPQGGWPPDVGLLCQNVGTAAAIARWARTGEPLIRRVITVTGSGVVRPCNFEARVGAPLAGLIEAAGGYAGTPRRLWSGGSMTGRALADDAMPLVKTMNCIVAATDADLRLPAGPELPCIRCGDCARVCPAVLLPQQLHRAVVSGDADAAERFGLADCIECGCCDYVCPSAIPLTERFRVARIARRERLASEQRAAQARLHFELHQRRGAAREDERRREFEEARRRARGQPPDGD
jgi:electron transport complex protein RnfC